MGNNREKSNIAIAILENWTIDKVDFGHFPKNSQIPVFGCRKCHKKKM